MHRRLLAVGIHEALQFLRLLYLCGGAVHRCHTLVWRSEDNLNKPVLSFHHVGSRVKLGPLGMTTSTFAH